VLGLRSWIDTTANAVTTAENKPVYFALELVRSSTEDDLRARTYEDKDPLGVLLPTFGHLIILFRCKL